MPEALPGDAAIPEGGNELLGQRVMELAAASLDP